jgi:hypothetical protein
LERFCHEEWVYKGRVFLQYSLPLLQQPLFSFSSSFDLISLPYPTLNHPAKHSALFSQTFNMHILPTLVLLTTSLLTTATPITSPNPADLSTRADKWCRLKSTVNSDVRCRKGAGTGYDLVRWIHPSDRFGVGCKANGEIIEGNRVWDYIPGWGCWVTAHYTNDGCENGVPWC